MADDDGTTRHDLANAEQEALALRQLLERAANELEALAASDGGEEAQARALRMAERLRAALAAEG